MKHIVTFSGGKDSLATLIWAKKNLPEFEVIFCDTGWESPVTYEHIAEVEAWFGLKIKVLTMPVKVGVVMDGPRPLFHEMVIKKGRAPSTKARFCTEELKVKPSIDYILSLTDDVTVYQGIRADESPARRKMKMEDEYFKHYFEPRRTDKNGKPVFDSYRGKEVRAWCDRYAADVYRPIFLNTANEVFDQIRRYGIRHNPLYNEGFTRVGCFPCIMCGLGGIRLIATKYPERIAVIRQLEEEAGTTFFPFEYIPQRYCTKVVMHRVDEDEMTLKEVADYQQVGKMQEDEDGRFVMVPKRCPTIDDVVKYVTATAGQQSFFEAPKCQSVYSICE